MSHLRLNQKGIAAGLLLVAIVVAGCGLVLINVANSVTGMKSFSETWPSTQGKIESIKVAYKKEKAIPEVAYSYQVEGENYTGERIYLTDGPYEEVTRSGTTLEINVFPPQGTETESLTLAEGQIVTVYYNPHLPKEAVLVRYGLGDLKLFMILGVIGIIVGLALVAKSLTTETFD